MGASVDIEAVVAALRRAADQMVHLLRSDIDPETSALGDWNVAELAMHVSQTWLILPGLLRRELDAALALVPDLRTEGSPLEDLWDSPDLMTKAVEADPERDLKVIAGRLAASADGFLPYAATQASAHEGDIPWVVNGVLVPPVTLLCHLLSETLVHGHDLATATDRSWTISDEDARLVLEGVVVPVTKRLPPPALVRREIRPGEEFACEIRLRGGGRYTFSFDRAGLTVRDAGAARPDVFISARPGALLLVVWGRTTPYPHVLRGRVLAWGRKPWLALKLPRLLRNP